MDLDKIQEKFIKFISEKKLKNSESFLKLKKSFFSENKMAQPTNADLRELYEKMIKQRKTKRNLELEKAMLSRAVRTQSGVAVIAVLTKPSTCPGKCIFCPTEKNMPKSYLSNEPAVMRAIMNKFDPYRQVQSRIKALELNGHLTDKIELIVMGGTFSYFPKAYQKKFITECFRACNDYKITGALKQKNIKTTLEREQKRNEKIKHRIVGLTLETRPDYINEKEILNFRNLGCTRVELGVQSIFDDVLKLNDRGHDIAETIRATKLLKDAGFKINYHMMPGLLGSSSQKDYKMFEQLFSNQNFQPDMLKIYPTVVIKNSKLYKLWKNKKYKAMTDKQFENLVIKIKNDIIPQYIRIQRLVRDVPLPSIEAGPKVSNLRQLVAEKTSCQCIRCREIKGEYKSSDKIILDRIDYNASDGKEIFLQFTSPNKKSLYALLRLRITDDKKHFIPTLEDSAIIREVHTYGKLASVGTKSKKSPQHIGLGKKLIKEAEKIAKKEFSISKIAVISGVGVRDYYRKLGYRLKDSYMTKKI
jgi:elongator complex protein 3 (tRNA carboxymethyluridine synthase)